MAMAGECGSNRLRPICRMGALAKLAATSALLAMTPVPVHSAPREAAAAEAVFQRDFRETARLIVGGRLRWQFYQTYSDWYEEQAAGLMRQYRSQHANGKQIDPRIGRRYKLLLDLQKLAAAMVPHRRYLDRLRFETNYEWPDREAKEAAARRELARLTQLFAERIRQSAQP